MKVSVYKGVCLCMCAPPKAYLKWSHRLQVWEKKRGVKEEEAVMKVHNRVQRDADEGEKERKKEWGKENKRQPPP